MEQLVENPLPLEPGRPLGCNPPDGEENNRQGPKTLLDPNAAVRLWGVGIGWPETGESGSMDSRTQHEDPGTTDAALDFVKFCYRRRRVGWPELYDEMCHVASRGLYHGWGFGELAEHNIAFGLAEMPRLAALVAEVVRGDAERRGRLLVGVMSPVPTRMDRPEEASDDTRRAAVFVGAAR